MGSTLKTKKSCRKIISRVDVPKREESRMSDRMSGTSAGGISCTGAWEEIDLQSEVK